jgi:hypothetical protein
MAEEKKGSFAALRSWVDSARLSDLTYHRTRQQLWGKLSKIWDFRQFDKTLFKSLKSCLCCRSDEMDDNKKLAFETALDEIEMMLDEAVDDVDDEAIAPAVLAAPKRAAPREE